VNGIAEALASVSKSEQELVAKLYGFDGEVRTEAEVARLCGQSLSQLDESAKKVLRRMRHPACSKLIREAVADADASIWTAMAGEHGIISK
jgi:DNA-directed RNA polymerase sigma subunit (sigma70/sigma32)